MDGHGVGFIVLHKLELQQSLQSNIKNLWSVQSELERRIRGDIKCQTNHFDLYTVGRAIVGAHSESNVISYFIMQAGQIILDFPPIYLRSLCIQISLYGRQSVNMIVWVNRPDY